MLKETLNEENIIARFDKLAALGIIVYGPSRIVRLTDEHFKFEFRICPTWSKKPMEVGDVLQLPDNLPEPAKFGPGSDIFRSHPDQVVKNVNNTHILALNIFPVFRPQYLLLTLDSFRSQNECLDHEDIEAAWAFLKSATSPHFAMYNCTKDAGCSRYHKHMQILKKPGDCDSDFRFFPDIGTSTAAIPYIHFVHHFPVEALTDGASIFDAYLKLLKKCRRVLGIREDDERVLCSHNMILVKEWIAVIPRRRGKFEGIGTNAAGMLGMPTISNDVLFKKWMDIGPAKVLRELGVPAGDLNKETLL